MPDDKKPQNTGGEPEAKPVEDGGDNGSGGFWTEPVSYITEGYKPGEIETILREARAKKAANKVTS